MERRLFNLVKHLKNNNGLTAARLANLCSTTERTIYRDIRKLDDYGIQIVSMGRNGYHLIDAQQINLPAKLNQEEYLALHIFHSIACQNKDKNSILYNSYKTAMEKVMANIKTDKNQPNLPQSINERIRIYDNQLTKEQLDLTKLLVEALITNTTIECKYDSASSGQTL